METLILYVDEPWVSPYVFSAFVALKEKELPFEIKMLSLQRKEHQAPEYRDASLTGRLPALRHGDYWLSESTAIAEYLAETFPFPGHPRLFPGDFRERGRCRQLQAWLRSDLLPLRLDIPTTSVFHRRAVKPLSIEGEQAAATLLRVADQVISEGRTTLFAAWCIADADFGLMLQRLNLNGHPLPPKVKAYADAQWLRPSVREYLDHPRPSTTP